MVLLLCTSCGAFRKESAKNAYLVKEDPTLLEQEEGALKTGLGTYTTVDRSFGATEEKNGLGEANACVAAVLVDKQGIVVCCEVDCTDTQVHFSPNGVIRSDASAAYLSMWEESFEWREQADAFATYCEGKTLEEIRKIPVDENGRFAEKTLAGLKNLNAAGLVQAVTDAVANAEYLGAHEGDRLGMGILTSISNSFDASAERNGQAQPYSNITAVTLNEENIVTSCILDAIQAKISFDRKGNLTSDISLPVITKARQKEDYGMLVASGIEREWYQQAESFGEYCKGKTLEEIIATSMDDGGHPTDEDLAASVTMHVNDSIKVLEQAAGRADDHN